MGTIARHVFWNQHPPLMQSSASEVSCRERSQIDPLLTFPVVKKPLNQRPALEPNSWASCIGKTQACRLLCGSNDFTRRNFDVISSSLSRAEVGDFPGFSVLLALCS